MKSFLEFLSESKKVYPFKIGVAGPLPEGFSEKLEMSLKKYDISKISTGKKTPIQERPLDFPQLQNTEVTYFDVELNYPTTSQVMQEYVGHCCNVLQSHIIVRNPNEPQELYQERKEPETYETLLTKEDMGGESAQQSVAGNRVMDLLKELETARKERDADPIAGVSKGESKNMDDKTNTKSPMGS
jgi:hypothetical protein